jgi:1-aminocyclopropane-1-carboxylate deaminase/D-cysteine desulfhydrase-like pyridoxal-dependent ACC family enzyme
MIHDINLSNISIDKLSLSSYIEMNVETDVLRLDKIHPLISGNKWFKLRYYLEEAKNENKKTIVTYGGAWSNHLLATAASCKIYKFSCFGIVRGEEIPKLSPTLLKAKELGMQLIFINREDYRSGKIPDQLKNADSYFIPEGGYGINGAKGAATILDYCKKDAYTHICCASGTGTMTAGLINSSSLTQQIISISVLKNNYSLEEKIELISVNKKKNYQLIHDYHFGGYAKHKPELLNFMNDFFRESEIPSDFVYTGKLFFAINDLIRNRYFPPGCRLLLIHSGGLQGNNSLSNGTLIF